MLKLHLGCGQIIKEGWVNVDLEPAKGGIRRDLSRPFPEESDSVDFIFHEHFIEHLTREQGVAFLKECYRVLRPGGVMRLSTPDLYMLAIWYQQGPIDQWPGTWEPKSPARFFNEAMRLWGHQFLYDQEEIGDVLAEAGFKTILVETHGTSDYDELREIEARPYHQDLIVEATK